MENIIATYLPINQTLMAKGVSKSLSNFNIPYFNNIFIMTLSGVNQKEDFLYFGDNTSMYIYEMLKIIYGVTPPETFATYIDGYTYKWKFATKTFTIYDENGGIVETRYGVKKVVDLEIDYTIFENHAFEIEIGVVEDSGSFLQVLPIYPIAFHSEDTKVSWGYMEENAHTGQEEADKIVVYLGNPTNYTNSLGVMNIELTASHIWESNKALYEVNSSLNGTGGFEKNLYTVDFNTSEEVQQEWGAIEPDISILWPSNLSYSLFPNNHTTDRPLEFINNRPIYQPWLIFDIPLIFWTKYRPPDGGDDIYKYFTFILSPDWS